MYDRINKRAKVMMDQGLIHEVEQLKKMGLDDSFTSMKGIGYKEIFPYLDGVQTLDATIAAIQLKHKTLCQKAVNLV